MRIENIRGCTLDVRDLTSNDLVRIQRGKFTIHAGVTGFGNILTIAELKDLANTGFVNINGFVTGIPAIPIVTPSRVIVVSTSDYKERVFEPDMSNPDITLVLGMLNNNEITPSPISNMDLSKAMAPVITDVFGREYMSSSTHKGFFVTGLVDAQATVMQSALPFPKDLIPKAKRYLRARMGVDALDQAYIYTKDNFINVLEP